MRTVLLSFLLLVSIPADADESPFPIDATVVGKVADSRMMVHRKPRTTLFYVRLKMEVEAVETGAERVGGAPFLDIRCWREGEDGHLPIPADGARFRARLAWNEEGYWVPSAKDSFELLAGSEARVFPDLPPRRSKAGAIVGGAFGLLALVATVLLRYHGRPPRDRSWGEAPSEEAPPGAADDRQGD